MVEWLKTQKECVSQFGNNKKTPFVGHSFSISPFCAKSTRFALFRMHCFLSGLLKFCEPAEGAALTNCPFFFTWCYQNCKLNPPGLIAVKETQSQGFLLLGCLYKGSKHSWGICWPIIRGGEKQYLSNTHWNGSKGSVQVYWVIVHLCEYIYSEGIKMPV